MANPGLSQVQLPVEAAVDAEAATAGPLVKAATSKNSPSIVGNVALDPTQTEQILQNMQQMLDQKTGFFSQLNSGLEDISAWGSGGKNGPTQALALRSAERRKDEEDIQKLRMDMAMTRASAAQQENLGKSLDKLTSGAGGKGTFSIVDPQVMQEVDRLKGLRRYAEAEKFYQDSLKKAAEVYAAPGMDKPEISQSVWDPEQNKYVTKLVSAREYRQNLANGTGEETPESMASMRAILQRQKEMPDGGMLPALTKAVYGQESSSGKADTSKPNYAGAVGPMQILPKTFEGLKEKNLIPKDYDINNEAHNKEAGFALLSDYAKTYNNDPDKILAAYYAGPKAINADGSINRDWKDTKNDKAPTVGQYIDQVKARILAANPAAAQAAAVSNNVPGRPPKPVSAQELQRQEEIGTAYQKEAAKTTAEASRKSTEKFLENTDAGVVNTQKTLSTRLGTLVDKYKDDPKVVNLINGPGMGNAVATALRDGLQTPFGSVGFQNLEDAYQKSLKGVLPHQIEARQEIAQILAAYSLEVSRSSSGQGSVSDFERSMFKQIAGSTSNSMELLSKVQKTMAAKADFAQRSRDLYDQEVTAKNGNVNFAVFQASPAYKNAANQYFAELQAINGPLKQTASSEQKGNQPPPPKWKHTEEDYAKYKKINGLS